MTFVTIQGLANVLYYLAAGMLYEGKPNEAIALAKESVDLCYQIDDKKNLVLALFWHGHISCVLGDYDIAWSSASKCLVVAEEIRDVGNISGPLSTLGRISLQRGHFQAAGDYLKKSEQRLRKFEDMAGAAIIIAMEVELAYLQGDYELANVYAKEAIEIWQKQGNTPSVAGQLFQLGQIARQQNNQDQALIFLKRSLKLFQKLEQFQGVAQCLAGIANVAVAEDQPEEAARHFGAAEAVLDRCGSQPEAIYESEFKPRVALDRAEYEHNVAAVREALGSDAFLAAWTTGRELSQELITAYVMEN